MDRDRVIKNLIRAAKRALKQPEFSTPRADGIGWSNPEWDGLRDAIRDAEKYARATQKNARTQEKHCRASKIVAV